MVKFNVKFSDFIIFKKATYRRLFDTEDGKVVLHDLIERNFVKKPTAVSGDEVQSLINEGRRDAILDILQIVTKSSDQFVEELKRAEEASDSYVIDDDDDR